MTKKLLECPYCKRPADERGGINHVGGCTGLQTVSMNRLQYDGLLAELERQRAEIRSLDQANGGALQEIERLRNALEFLYDKWENGTPCTDEGEPDGASMGNAFQLSDQEENWILSLIPKESTNPQPPAPEPVKP